MVASAFRLKANARDFPEFPIAAGDGKCKEKKCQKEQAALIFPSTGDVCRIGSANG
jgi:hypothetical protein